jgi:voltage-gated potassium channel
VEAVIQFLKIYALGIYYTSPFLIALVSTISFLGILVGRKEKWTLYDSLYFAFITATTVGFGDFHPKKPGPKLLSIFIALFGLLLTGIIVAIGLAAVEHILSTRILVQQS